MNNNKKFTNVISIGNSGLAFVSPILAKMDSMEAIISLEIDRKFIWGSPITKRYWFRKCH
jgi:hypothetical protein